MPSEGAEDENRVDCLAQDNIEGDVDWEGDEDMKKYDFSDREEDEDGDHEENEEEVEVAGADVLGSEEEAASQLRDQMELI